jgi:hypothetical protein
LEGRSRCATELRRRLSPAAMACQTAALDEKQ